MCQAQCPLPVLGAYGLLGQTGLAMVVKLQGWDGGGGKMGGEHLLLAPDRLKHLRQLTWKCLLQNPMLGTIPKGSWPLARSP